MVNNAQRHLADPAHVSPVTLRDVWVARKRIAPFVSRTPLTLSPTLSARSGASIFLKLETLQETGAFKVRGAANKILSLTPDERKRGVTTFSTGNHGLAVAYIARKLRIRAVICISRHVPRAKVDAIKRLGARVEIDGDSQDDAERKCYELQERRGLAVIKPFDDPFVIAGQGTIGLELLEDLPEIETAVVPLSGGGLIAGIGCTLKSTSPDIRVIGVSMERSAAMYHSLRAGRPVVVAEHDTLADSLLGGIGMENQCSFGMVQRYVDAVSLVSEQAIAEGMAVLLDQHRMVVEGAAATGIAALLHGQVARPGSTIAVIVSGNNVDTRTFLDAIGRSTGVTDAVSARKPWDNS
jgi:threonine dehydratase